MNGTEWLLSKRLSTENRLTPYWRGNGLATVDNNQRMQVGDAEYLASKKVLPTSDSYGCFGNGKRYNVSNCGRFLLIISGSELFVYLIDQRSNSIILFTRLIANGEILKVSMDTGSGRVAIAALLEGRIGALWDLGDKFCQTQLKYSLDDPLNRAIRMVIHGSEKSSVKPPPFSGNLPVRRAELHPIQSHQRFLDYRDLFSSSIARYIPFTYGAQIQSQRESYSDRQSLCNSPDSEPPRSPQYSGLPIQAKATRTYSNLCSADDPPRSIAICPQRNCVAFGCRMGIELRWVDALTERDLTRWFPLVVPSDHLYFLPQRPGIDSTRKLRLISSAASPVMPNISRRDTAPLKPSYSASGLEDPRRRSMTRLFFGDIPFPSSATSSSESAAYDSDHSFSQNDERQGILRTVDSDHYHAKPLSDGSHILFTDPNTGLLCLGSDAPLGGPTKLTRKIVFVPPTDTESVSFPPISCYAAGRQLSWGVRIVSAYRDGRLVLYNVPSDVFGYMKNLRSSYDMWDEQSGVICQSDLLMDELMGNNSGSSIETEGSDESVASMINARYKTLKVDGVIIGQVKGDTVDDLLVDCAYGGLKTWIFFRSGNAKLMSIFAPRATDIRRRFIGVDGLTYS